MRNNEDDGNIDIDLITQTELDDINKAWMELSGDDCYVSHVDQTIRYIKQADQEDISDGEVYIVYVKPTINDSSGVAHKVTPKFVEEYFGVHLTNPKVIICISSADRVWHTVIRSVDFVRENLKFVVNNPK